MRLANIVHLGVKELRGLGRNTMLLVLVLYAFSLSIYMGSKAMPETLNRASIAIVDEDQSAVSSRIANSFYLTHFMPPRLISQPEMDLRMDAGLDTFALDIPPNFQRDLLAGKLPTIQLMTGFPSCLSFPARTRANTSCRGSVKNTLRCGISTMGRPSSSCLRAQ